MQDGEREFYSQICGPELRPFLNSPVSLNEGSRRKAFEKANDKFKGDKR